MGWVFLDSTAVIASVATQRVAIYNQKQQKHCLTICNQKLQKKCYLTICAYRLPRATSCARNDGVVCLSLKADLSKSAWQSQNNPQKITKKITQKNNPHKTTPIHNPPQNNPHKIEKM